MSKDYNSLRTGMDTRLKKPNELFVGRSHTNRAVFASGVLSGGSAPVKKYFAALLLLCSISVFPQYVRSTFAATYTPITVGGGATQIVGGTGTANFSTTAGVSNLDDAAALIPLPFAFTYNATAFTTSNYVNVCTNGYLSFGTANTNASKIVSQTNTDFFNPATSGNIIAGWWDDLNAGVGTGQVLYQTQGSAGSRTFTVQYTNYMTFYANATSTINFQIILYETSNVIELRYGTATNLAHNPTSIAESATVGIKWGAGPGNYIDAFTGSKSVGTSVNNSENFPATTIGYRFTPGTPVAIAAGTYNVGTGQIYPTLSQAIADVNHRGVSGAVVLNCTDASYPAASGNIYPMLLAPIAGTSASNTVTVNGNGAVLSYRGAYNNAVIHIGATATTELPCIGIIGSDYVTVRNFTLNLSATAPATTAFTVPVSKGISVLNYTATDGATNNTVRDITIALDRTNTASIGLQQNTLTAASSALGANSGNKYYNLSISNAYSGAYLLGTAAFPDLNCELGTISGGTTTIGGATANDIGNGSSQTWGIRAANQSGAKIFNTEVRNVTVTGSVLSDGIFLESFLGNNEIYNNSVHDIKNSSTSATTGVTGIRFTHATSGINNLKVYNNFVYGINSGYTGSASATRQLKGIYAAGTGGSASQSMNIDFNSVRMDHSANPKISSACWEIATSAPVYTVRNNIFDNATGAQTGVAKHYGVVSTSSTLIGGAGSAWNHNIIYIPTATNGFTALNTGTPTDYATLASWQAHAAAPDANSFNQNPQFNSATDLKINTASISPAESNGSYFSGAISWVGSDKEGDARNASTPDIGADEFTGPSCTDAIAGTASASAAFCGPAASQVLTASGYSAGTGSTYQWVSSANSADYPNAGTPTGQTDPATMATGAVAATTYYWLRVACATNSSTANSNMVTITINPLPAAAVTTGAGTYCTSTTIGAGNGNDGIIYFQGTTSNGTSTATPATSKVVTATGTYYFRAQNPTTLCWGAEGSVSVVIQAPAGITGTDGVTCIGGTATIAATASNCTGFVNSGTTISGTWAVSDPIAKEPASSITNTATCSFDASVTRNYVATAFQVSATGSYTFEMNSNAAFDGMAYITSGSFTPGNCAGGGTWIKGDDDSGTGLEPKMTATLTAGTTYTLISTTYGSSSGTYAGPFGWTITPPVGQQIMLPASGTIQWYTAASGGTPIGTGSPFNPVGVANSGLANTNTAGTTAFYAACSFSTSCRTAVAFTISGGPTVDAGAAVPTVCQSAATIALGGSFGGNASGAVWSDGGAGGTFANNTGTTPGTTTYTPAANAASPVTLRLDTTGGSCGTVFATKQLVINPGLPYYTDADGDGYDNGAATVLFCNQQPGYILVTGGIDCNDNNAEINPNHVEILSNGIDDNCDTFTDEAYDHNSFVIPAQCGLMMTTLTNTIYAYEVPRATNYRFEVTNGSTVRIAESPYNRVTLSDLPGGVTYSTTYSIRVSLKIDGFWRAYYGSCNVTTPALAETTNVVASQCGSTLAALSTTIYCNQVLPASQYRFEVTGGMVSPRTFDSATNRFNMLNLPGSALYATTYSVRVALFLYGIWQNYGAACNITTPAGPPTTTIIATQCGTTISNSWAPIYANAVTEATGYRFEVSTAAPASVSFVDSPTSRFNLHQLTGGYLPNTVYSIRVAILYNGVYQDFGPACTITTAGVLTKLAVADTSVFDVKAYPNPYVNTFKLDLSTSSEERIEVKIYDMIGRLVETRQANVSELGSLEIGDRYPSGVYNVVVAQGDNVKTLRIVKR